jgi:hypothetical protein
MDSVVNGAILVLTVTIVGLVYLAWIRRKNDLVTFSP